MRKTLVVRGLPQTDDNESWDKTSELLSKKIQEITENRMTENETKSIIERAHRVKGELKNGSRGKPIIVQFHSWKSSELIKK